MKKEDMVLEHWKLASELHRHEDNLIWQRFGYYVTLTGFLVTALGFAVTADSLEAEDRYHILITISLFGFVISGVFASIFRRAYLYHIHRILQADRAEKILRSFVAETVSVYSERFGEEKPYYEKDFPWLFDREKTGNVIFYLAIFMIVFWTLVFFIGLERQYGIIVLYSILLTDSLVLNIWLIVKHLPKSRNIIVFIFLFTIAIGILIYFNARVGSLILLTTLVVLDLINLLIHRRSQNR